MCLGVDFGFDGVIVEACVRDCGSGGVLEI